MSYYLAFLFQGYCVEYISAPPFSSFLKFPPRCRCRREQRCLKTTVPLTQLRVRPGSLEAGKTISEKGSKVKILLKNESNLSQRVFAEQTGP